jgi:hypothetical protein
LKAIHAYVGKTKYRVDNRRQGECMICHSLVTTRNRRSSAPVAWILWLVVFAGSTFCQTTRPASGTPAGLGANVPQGVVYKDGQLTIDVLDSTLVDILRKVASLTNIRIDIPMEANGERVPMIKLGPGTACDVLASLLRDTHFNFLIAASDSDPGKLQSVLIMPMDTKESTAPRREGMPTGPSPRRPFGAVPEQEASSDPRTGTEGPNHSVESGSLNQPGQSNPDSPTPNPPSSGDAPIGSLAWATAQADVARAAALSPPPVLNQETIGQQLQQMYQQRMQMIQQGRQGNASGNAGH